MRKLTKSDLNNIATVKASSPVGVLPVEVTAHCYTHKGIYQYRIEVTVSFPGNYAAQVFCYRGEGTFRADAAREAMLMAAEYHDYLHEWYAENAAQYLKYRQAI
jgi:hypothetical protein